MTSSLSRLRPIIGSIENGNLTVVERQSHALSDVSPPTNDTSHELNLETLVTRPRWNGLAAILCDDDLHRLGSCDQEADAVREFVKQDLQAIHSIPPCTDRKAIDNAMAREERTWITREVDTMAVIELMSKRAQLSMQQQMADDAERRARLDAAAKMMASGARLAGADAKKLSDAILRRMG